jgi:hypothetical protein
MRRATVVLLLLCGCADRQSASAPKPAAKAAAKAPPAPTGPPNMTFRAPEAWRSWKDPSVAVAPPDPARETWRVMVQQHRPMQRATPRWQPLPATETVVVAMPKESGFRCVVGPLDVAPEADESGTRLEAWVLRRDLLCSVDGFRSWTEHGHELRVLADGTRRTTATGRALVRERIDPTTVREAFVLMRDDEDLRTATTGPPRIMPDRVVED